MSTKKSTYTYPQAPHASALEWYGYLSLLPFALLAVLLFVEGSIAGAILMVFAGLVLCRLLRAAGSVVQHISDIRCALEAITDISDETRTLVSYTVPDHPVSEK